VQKNCAAGRVSLAQRKGKRAALSSERYGHLYPLVAPNSREKRKLLSHQEGERKREGHVMEEMI